MIDPTMFDSVTDQIAHLDKQYLEALSRSEAPNGTVDRDALLEAAHISRKRADFLAVYRWGGYIHRL